MGAGLEGKVEGEYGTLQAELVGVPGGGPQEPQGGLAWK